MGWGLRVGELCGLHLVDLHLRPDAACGQCRTPHGHICHWSANLNRAEAKTKQPWRIEDATVTGGLIRGVSPAMVHTYVECLTTGYPRGSRARDGAGRAARRRWAGVGVGGCAADARPGRQPRRARAGQTARVRHRFTSAVRHAFGGSLLIVGGAGGWALTAMVEEIYGRVDVHDPAFDDAGSLTELDLDDSFSLPQPDRDEAGALPAAGLLHPGPDRPAGLIETTVSVSGSSTGPATPDVTGIGQRWLRELLWDTPPTCWAGQAARAPVVPVDAAGRAITELGAFLTVDASGRRSRPPRARRRAHAALGRRLAPARPRRGWRRWRCETSTAAGPRSATTPQRGVSTASHGAALGVQDRSGPTARSWPTGHHRRALGWRCPAAGPPPLAGPGRPRAGRPDQPGPSRRGLPPQRPRHARAPGTRSSPLDAGSTRLSSCGGTTAAYRCSGPTRPRSATTTPRSVSRNARYDILAQRQRKTLDRFTARHDRQPTAAEGTRLALFASKVGNPDGATALTYQWFHPRFRPWVTELDLGDLVPPGAAHAGDQPVFRAGATVTHIRGYLGQICDRMAEHYVHLA